MRRFFVGVALYTLAAVTPLAAWGGDREIAEQIFSKLKGQQAAGVLEGFTLDLGVKDGEVVLKGSVSNAAQRDAVLKAAHSVEGVTNVVNEVSIKEASMPKPVKIEPIGGQGPAGFELSKALAEESPAKVPAAESAVRPVAATESAPASDAQITSTVKQSLGAALRSGRLQGFGVDVSTKGGDVVLRGIARSAQTKSEIVAMARRTPGVRNVIDDIRVESAPATQQVRHLQPVEVQNVNGQVPLVSNGQVAPAQPVTFQDTGVVPGGGEEMSYGAPAPVPMSPIPQAYAAPRYDNPNLPNYAWPGYAAYPNYAAVTYPQQYSPTAWPYIGPFYPYPQVPLGWRRVSLEWDDGWWFLDFTDK